PRAFTAPARWMAPPWRSSFSVSVVFPASGWEMIANVRRRMISALSFWSSIEEICWRAVTSGLGGPGGRGGSPLVEAPEGPDRRASHYASAPGIKEAYRVLALTGLERGTSRVR